MAEQTPDIVPELAELRTPPKAFSVPAPKELTGLSTEMGAGMPGVPEDYAAARARFKKPVDVSTEQATMLQRQGRLEQDIGMATQAKEQYLADAKADIATQEREAAQRVEKNLDVVREKFPYKEFHPTKDNIESISTLFGLIGVIGAALGGAGKMSAVTSLNAMGGMMKGWQMGRADLWKKEKDEFDKGMLRVKAILEDAYKDADRAVKTLAYNRSEAEALAAQSAAKLGGQVGKQILAKQGIERYFTFLDGVKKDLTEAERRAFEEKKFNAEQAYRAKQLALREQEIAAKANSPTKQGQNALTFASRVYGNIENATNDLVNLTNLPAVAQSPIFAGMIGVDRDTVLRNITAFAARKVSSADERAFEQIANSLDAALARLEAQGLATGATKGAIASFGALKPREGDDAINMAIYLARVKQEIETGIIVHNEMPGATPGQKQNNVSNIERINKIVPFNVDDTLNILKANRKPLGKKMEQLVMQPQIVPNVNLQPQDRQSKYEMGQVIKKGNKTYRIIGLDDPNDPDIEEVK